MSTYRLKITIILVFLFVSRFFSSAQEGGNLPYVDYKFLHFGFSLGINFMDYGIKTSGDSINGKVYDARVSFLNPGFSVGMISDMRLSRYLNLRFTPTLQLGQRQLNFYATGFSDSIINTSIPICLPIYLKYSAERKGNYRPYLIWGGGMYLDLGRKTTEDMVLLKPLDFYTEFGVGCDIYYSFFKLAPELKFALGFNNMLTPVDQRDAGFITPANNFYTRALTKLTSRVLTLTFNFE